MDALIGEIAAALHATGNPVAATLGGHLDTLDAAGPAARVRTPELPALSFLAGALAAPDAHPLTGRIGRLRTAMPWREVEPSRIPASFVGAHAFCELTGPDGLVPAHDFRTGLYLQVPGYRYRDHSHEAEEVYLVLSGTADWRAGTGAFEPRAPGSLIHHRAGETHAMHTGPEPLLALWGWLGDIGFDSYHVDM